MIITQIFNISIGGVDVTDKVDTASLSISEGRVFNVLIIKAAHEPQRGESVMATVGDTTFTGFVHSVEKSSNIIYETVCRSNGAKLLEPYSEATTKLENANTSTELFSLYTTETGVNIVDTTAEIDFIGSFYREGDHATAIGAVANVTGAEVYADGYTVQIAPNKPITERGIVIEDNEIFDFAETIDTNDGGGIGFVDINNGGEKYSGGVLSGDTAENTINTELDKETGELMIYLSPNGSLSSISGITSPTSAYKKRSDSTNISDSNAVELMGAIKSIDAVTVNGAKVTNYDYVNGQNVITFITPVTGRVQVEYTAYMKRAFVTTKPTPDGPFYDYEIVYRDKTDSGYGVLRGATTSQREVGDSAMYVMDGDDNIIYSDSSSLRFSVYHNGSIVDASVLKTASLDPYVESISYVDTDSHENVFYPRFPYSDILGVDGNPGGYSEVTIDGRQAVVFDAAAPGAKISYTMSATKYTIESNPNDGDYVSIVATDGTHSAEHSYTYSDQSGISCALPMEVTVNIANELGVSVAKVSGKAIPMADDQGNSYGTKYTDSFGKVSLNITLDGRYRLDTGAIIEGSYIIVVVDTGSALW